MTVDEVEVALSPGDFHCGTCELSFGAAEILSLHEELAHGGETS